MEQTDGEISHVDPAIFYWKEKDRKDDVIILCCGYPSARDGMKVHPKDFHY